MPTPPTTKMPAYREGELVVDPTTPPSTWLPPETARGIRNFIEDRATEHRAREEASAGTDASTEAAIRAEECVDIVTDLERYWGAG